VESFVPTIDVSWQEAIESMLTSKSSTQLNNSVDQTVQKAQENLTGVFDSTIQPNPETRQKSEQLQIQPNLDTSTKPVPDSARPKPTSSPKHHLIELDPKIVAQLHQESEQLQERLTVEDEETQEQLPITPAPDPVPVTPPVTPIASNVTDHAPEVDEEWKIILQQWQPEHWEIFILLYQEQYAQLTTVERKVHRPVSRLIDEINLPVDEQLGDLLIDPDTQTISHHLHATAERLVRWYLSSISSI
jgi:hypothetical protein